MNIGFSQRRAAVTMWAWTACLGAAALATRFVPFREGGHWHPWETVAVAAIALVALAFSVYIVYLLEIVKLGNPRIRRRLEEQATASAQPERWWGVSFSRTPGCPASAGRLGFRCGHKLRQGLVEGGMPLRGVAVAGEDEPLGGKALLEHVADGVEAGVVGARDDELRERGRGEPVERDLRLPRAALDDQRARALQELVGQRRGGHVVGADVLEEAAQERLRVVGRPVTPPLDPLPREGVRVRVAGRDLRAGGSITVSERTRSGTAAAASSEMTPP